LIPLLRYRHRPGHAEVQRLLNRERNVRTSLDIALQKQAADILQTRVQAAKKERGAAVVLAADTGDLLASVSYPWPENLRRLSAVAESEDDDEAEQGAAFDRARWGIYPPGSTFKVVTALAALRKHPQVSDESFTCQALNSRQGAMVRGHSVYDDEADGASGHGAVTLEQGLVQSCNAYFAQLAVERIGADALWQTASQMELGFTRDAGQDKLREVFRQDLPQAAYGQGPVYVTPFQMARVAAAVANGGQMPYGRWVIDDSNARQQAPLALVTRAQAALIAHAMRGVVLRGTGKRLAGLPLAIAGKTGTAENRPKNNEDKASHSWFIGFAPFEAEARQRFAFSVIVEHGGYGGALAAPIAGELALAAAKHKPANSKPGERHGIPHQSW
jgi:peptidoglycan glycosyltransferase